MEKSLKGLFKTITVTDTSITLLKNNGKKLSEFPFLEVTNFIFEKGTTWKFGFLTICLSNGAGYNINRSTVASDQNSITFNSQSNDSFELLYSELRGMVQLKSLEDLKPAAVDFPDLKPAQSIPIKNNVVSSRFCTNCGAKLVGGKFCPECGAPIADKTPSSELESAVPISPQTGNKKSFWQKTVEQGREINRQKELQKASQPKPLSKKERIKENKANGVACCPKCGSTSISANRRGWKVTTGLLGSSKIIVTCMNCGHHWRP